MTINNRESEPECEEVKSPREQAKQLYFDLNKNTTHHLDASQDEDVHPSVKVRKITTPIAVDFDDELGDSTYDNQSCCFSMCWGK